MTSLAAESTPDPRALPSGTESLPESITPPPEPATSTLDVESGSEIPLSAEHELGNEHEPSQEEGYFSEESSPHAAFADDENADGDSAVLDTPLPEAPVGNDTDEVMAAPTDTLPADVAFEDEGLLTLERIFLLSKSEHAFHRLVSARHRSTTLLLTTILFYRAYIARTLGDLLEDTDPCEAVEYVIPLLTGLALDEGESGVDHHLAVAELSDSSLPS